MSHENFNPNPEQSKPDNLQKRFEGKLAGGGEGEGRIELSDDKEEKKRKRLLEESAEIDVLRAGITGVKVEGVESQDQLASDYLAAYSEFRKIADKRSNDLRILDKLREEALAPDLIEEQEELYASSWQEYEEAMSKYSKIGEKLTEETKERYLK